MAAIIFRQYYNLPEAHVEFATLEAGGFHPTFHNQHHGVLNALSLIAFGGLIILIPEPEYEAAKTFLNDMQSTDVLQDYEPIPERRFGKWKTGTFFALLSGFFLPFFLMPLWLQLGAFLFAWGYLTPIWSGNFPFSNWPDILSAFLLLTPMLAMISIIFHATYYAVPTSKTEKQL